MESYGRPSAMRASLLAWFDADRRPMPWRDEPTPYRVWISEIMLQQTRVATVIPYFERFLARFPGLEALAAAQEEEVLSCWSGLGYYSRARNLRRAAELLLAEHGGILPPDPADLRRLPGIGPYTAGAIASIAFGLPEPALDGNGIRVLTRLHALGGDPARQPLLGELWRRLGELVACERPGDVNQAVMELGARICAPRSPDCGSCALSLHCEAREAGRATAYPETAPRAAQTDLLVEVGIFRQGDRLLLSRGERPFLRGLWNLPYRIRSGGASDEEETWEELGLSVQGGRPLGEASHSITRYRIRQLLVGGTATPLAAEGVPEYRWADAAERAELGLPSFSAKIIRDLG